MARNSLRAPLISLISTFFFTTILAACATTDTRTSPGQAAIKNFETRTVRATRDDVFIAATEALFDLGYVIEHSDKESGIIMGEQKDDRKSERALMTFFGGYAAGAAVRPTVYNLTLLIRPIDEATTNVRIKTNIDGEPKLNKRAIDQVWLYIERQVLMESPPSLVVPSETSPESALESMSAPLVVPSETSAKSVLESMSIPLGDGIVLQSAYLVFSGPGGDYDNLGSLPNGARVNVFEEKDGWYLFSSEEFPSGWISPSFSTKAIPEKKPTPIPVTKEEPVVTIVRRAQVYVAPSNGSVTLGVMPAGGSIVVLEEREKWFRFSCEEFQNGWIERRCTDRAERKGFRKKKGR